MSGRILVGCVLAVVIAPVAGAQIIPLPVAKQPSVPVYGPQPALSIFRNPAAGKQAPASSEPSINPLYPTLSIAPIISAPLVGSLLSGSATTPTEAESHARKTEAMGTEVTDLEKPVSPPAGTAQPPAVTQAPSMLQITALTLPSLDLKPLTLSMISPGGATFGPNNLAGLESKKAEKKKEETQKPPPPAPAAPPTGRGAGARGIGGIGGGGLGGGLGGIPRPRSGLGGRH